MKKITLLISSVLFFQLVYSQENIFVNKEKLDSIQNLLISNQQEDTTKVKRLNFLARIYFTNFEYENGLKASVQARELAEKLNYEKGEGLYLLTLAYFIYNPDVQSYYLFKANEKYDGIFQKEVFLEIEIPELNNDLIEKANNQLAASLKFFEKEKDKDITAQILFNSSIFLMPDNLTVALSYLDRAILLFKEKNQIGFAATVLTFKMYSLQSLGKIEDSKEVEKEVSNIIFNITNTQESIFLLRYLLRYQNLIGKNFAVERGFSLEAEFEKTNQKLLQILVLENLAVNFAFLDLSEKAVVYYKKAIELREEINYYDDAIRIYFNLGFDLVAIKQFDEAKIYFSKGKDLANKSENESVRQAVIERFDDGMGQILMGQGKYKEALEMFFNADDNFWIDYYKANCYYKLGNLTESISYGVKSYNGAVAYESDQRLLIKICLLLSEAYEQLGQDTKAFEYLKEYRNIIEKQKEENIANSSISFEIQRLIDKNNDEKEQLEKEKLLKEKQNQNQRWWLFSIAAGLFSSLVLVYLLFRNNKNKQKANELLNKQKEEIQNTLTQLKSTQSQLIQSEKMASLGELTAGIAHEIQNPLNFVNNFSEVNSELITELKEEIEKGDKKEALALADDIEGNEQKINHHGKRADSIVKGMLKHSRTSSGEKTLIDINVLADEYLRLSYHGIRAKDKSFNADFKLEADEKLPKMLIAGQDIGRVLLNLINNAFYAVNEKVKLGVNDYKPSVVVSTKLVNNKVEIRVQDNGSGIPESVKEKIFQPFFTTKPAGSGTGLGLSLSYDIVKAHDGTIDVNSKKGERTEFIIRLKI